MKKTPSIKSSCALLAGVLSAAAFVAAPSTASAQLQLTVLALDAQRIELSISGTLSGTPPTRFADTLYIQAPGESPIANDTDRLRFSGSQPLVGVTAVSGSVSLVDDANLGNFVQLPFNSDLTSGTTRGSGATFTLTPAAGTFDPSAITISDLALSWGYNGESGQPFGTLQSNAIPEPSAYAALLGLAALGCVALRRRVR